MENLETVDRRAIHSELIGLKMILGPIAHNPVDFTWEQLRFHHKRLRAMLPNDPDLVADIGSVCDVRSLTMFLDWLRSVFHLDAENSSSLPPRLFRDAQLDTMLADLMRRFRPAEPIRFADAESAAAPSDQPARSSRARYSDGFCSVHWFGTDYTFTRTQAACMKVLWEAWNNGTPEVAQRTILKRQLEETCDDRVVANRLIEADARRLRDVFEKGKHPAWGVMIQLGERKGTYRLVEPEI